MNSRRIGEDIAVDGVEILLELPGFTPKKCPNAPARQPEEEQADSHRDGSGVCRKNEREDQDRQEDEPAIDVVPRVTWLGPNPGTAGSAPTRARRGRARCG